MIIDLVVDDNPLIRYESNNIPNVDDTITLLSEQHGVKPFTVRVISRDILEILH